jgi:hypothetical protein
MSHMQFIHRGLVPPPCIPKWLVYEVSLCLTCSSYIGVFTLLQTWNVDVLMQSTILKLLCKVTTGRVVDVVLVVSPDHDHQVIMAVFIS